MKRHIVTIKQIDWIDKEGLEAEVLFEINGKTFWAFCHPCDFIEGEIAKVYFSFVEEEISDFASWNKNKEQRKEIIRSEENKWSYYCYGQLNSIHPVMIDCGTLSFSFNDWINNEDVIGRYLYFVISRLDIGRIN